MSVSHESYTVRRYSGLVGGGAAVAVPGELTVQQGVAAPQNIAPPMWKSHAKVWSIKATNTSATAATLSVYIQDQYANKWYIAYNAPLAVAGTLEMFAGGSFGTMTQGHTIYAQIAGASATADIYASIEILSP